MKRLIDAEKLIKDIHDFMLEYRFTSLDFDGIKDLIEQEMTAVNDPLSMDEYQKAASRTMNFDHGYYYTELHALFGMVSEIGELHGIYQKSYQGHEIDPEHVIKELGDLLWFVAEYCTNKGWSLSNVAKMNIEKLMKRYPHGFEYERSLHRDPEDV